MHATGQIAPTPPGPDPVQQSVSVTTTRSSVEVGASANTVATLSTDDLTDYPAQTLDESLRQHAGFELFRRSSFWVANPTSEGISLRCLGSTAASRTLVLTSGIPLNDSFGGWIHWDEFAPGTLEAVTLVSGGGSELYGSSALGGVIEMVPASPDSDGIRKTLVETELAGGGHDTSKLSARVDAHQHRFAELAAVQDFRTAGYITTAAPGPVDRPSNVHFETGRFALDYDERKQGRAFVVANILNEARGNGTTDQTNGTRLWRAITGDDWTWTDRVNGRVRVFGSEEAYRQSFSSINSARTAETLTRLQAVRTQELGSSADAAYHRARFALIAGGDVRDIRATDFETPISAGLPNGVQDTSARQRFIGGFVEGLGQLGHWSVAGSVRGDGAMNLATRVLAQTGSGQVTMSTQPDRTEGVASPRLGLVRQFGHGLSVHGDGFRAFRTPTMNELYRTGQVGQQTTLANAALTSERATGAEGGVSFAGKMLGAQATYFFTEINRPVSAVLVSSTATTTTNKRENLGQIQSQGVELATQIQAPHGLSANIGYQYAHAVVTSFSAQPALVGLWIPDVPRHTATAQLRYRAGSRGDVTLAARETGHAFDDSSNVYRLHGYFLLDAAAELKLHAHMTAFVSLQNVLNRAVETARTPNLTLGTPFTAQAGLRLRWPGQ
jgi:outer membrane receptor protein involved in Fe transport